MAVSLNEMQEKRTAIYKAFQKVDYISKPVSYEYFFHNYLLPNKLCIIGPWLTDSWQSRMKWKNKNGAPDLDYLQEKFGDVKCPIADCNKEQYSSHPKSEMTFSEYMDYLRKYRSSDYSKDMPCLYLKDWHCVRCFPGYQFYETPLFFQSDWLNEFWDERSDNVCDDYRFVYIGPKGSWTPFHADVLRSYSWSANICGRKKWIFFPPGEEEYLKDKFGELPFDLRSMDPDKYPHMDKVRRRVELYQNEGEVVFVPSGWHHQVFNLEDTISVNHNWLNGCNIDICWQFIQTSYGDVMKEIEDCREMDGWHQQCQLILKSTSGIDYKEFYHFIKLIASNRMKSLEMLVKPVQPSDNCDSTFSGSTQHPTELYDEKMNTEKQACDETNNLLLQGRDTGYINYSEHSVRRPIEHCNDSCSGKLTTTTTSTLSQRISCQSMAGTSSREHLVFDLKRIVDILETMVNNQYFREVYAGDEDVKPLELKDKLSAGLKL